MNIPTKYATNQTTLSYTDPKGKKHYFRPGTLAFDPYTRIIHMIQFENNMGIDTTYILVDGETSQQNRQKRFNQVMDAIAVASLGHAAYKAYKEKNPNEQWSLTIGAFALRNLPKKVFNFLRRHTKSNKAPKDDWVYESFYHGVLFHEQLALEDGEY